MKVAKSFFFLCTSLQRATWQGHLHQLSQTWHNHWRWRWQFGVVGYQRFKVAGIKGNTTLHYHCHLQNIDTKASEFAPSPVIPPCFPPPLNANCPIWFSHPCIEVNTTLHHHCCLQNIDTPNIRKFSLLTFNLTSFPTTAQCKLSNLWDSHSMQDLLKVQSWPPSHFKGTKHSWETVHHVQLQIHAHDSLTLEPWENMANGLPSPLETSSATSSI